MTVADKTFTNPFDIIPEAAAGQALGDATHVWDLFTRVVIIDTIKSGATQVAAGAAAGELWKTNGHATLPNNVIMIGV